jgi:hypothetical protein
MGCHSFVVCGGAGALHSELTLGHFVVVSSAIRDEGTSYHYLPPARSIQFDEAARSVLEEVLKARGAPLRRRSDLDDRRSVSGNSRKDRAPSSRRLPDRRNGGRCASSGGRFSRGAPCPGRVLRGRSHGRLMGSPLLAEPLRRSRGPVRPRSICCDCSVASERLKHPHARLPAFSLRVKAFGTHDERGHGWVQGVIHFPAYF